MGRVQRSRDWYRMHVRKRPIGALLEPTSNCNLNCPFCLVGQQNALVPTYGNAAHDLLHRPMGSMSQKTFDRARRELKDFGIRNVHLYFQGEPLMHRDIVPYARALKEDGFWVSMFTNGLLFTDRNIEPLLETEIDLIRFSVDGASQDTYKLNRVGGQFDRVFENMRKVGRAARDSATRVEWQYIALRNNEHEIAQAKEMSKGIGMNFFVKPYRVTDEHLVPVNPEYRCSLRKKPCTDIYLQLGIYWNGDVVPCCYDVDGQAIMGNINENSLDEIWESPKYRTFRQQVDDYQRNPEAEPELCKGCLRWGDESKASEGQTAEDAVSTV